MERWRLEECKKGSWRAGVVISRKDQEICNPAPTPPRTSSSSSNINLHIWIFSYLHVCEPSPTPPCNFGPFWPFSLIIEPWLTHSASPSCLVSLYTLARRDDHWLCWLNYVKFVLILPLSYHDTLSTPITYHKQLKFTHNYYPLPTVMNSTRYH